MYEIIDYVFCFPLFIPGYFYVACMFLVRLSGTNVLSVWCGARPTILHLINETLFINETSQ